MVQDLPFLSKYLFQILFRDQHTDCFHMETSFFKTVSLIKLPFLFRWLGIFADTLHTLGGGFMSFGRRDQKISENEEKSLLG